MWEHLHYSVRGNIARAKKWMWHKSECLTEKNDFFLRTKGYLLQPLKEPCCAAIEWEAQPGQAEEKERQSESVKLGTLTK